MNYSNINFVLVGPPKTGSYWLAQCLREHSQIYVSSENNFLTHHRNKGWSWWQQYFSEIESETLIGDYANWYFPYSNIIAEELARLNPQIKIIVSVRNPISRAVSNYMHDVRWGTLGRHVHLRDALRKDLLWYRYIYSGLYSVHIREYLKYFPPQQVYLFAAPSEGGDLYNRLNDLFAFLGVPLERVPSMDKKLNKTVVPLWPSLHRYATFGAFKYGRLIMRIFDPMNVFLGNLFLSKRIDLEDRKELQRIFKSFQEKEELRTLISNYPLRGRLFIDTW